MRRFDLEFYRYSVMIEVSRIYCPDYHYAIGQLEEHLIRRGIRVKVEKIDNHTIINITLTHGL